VPTPADFEWGVPATYMVTIVALPDAAPGTMYDYYDYKALLFDAAP